jgi:hypothetical protein
MRNFDRFAGVYKDTFPLVPLTALDTISTNILNSDKTNLISL